MISLLSNMLVAGQEFSLKCGNGRLDAGEQCDPLVAGTSTECCTASCGFAPVSQSCSNGFGVCKLGKCVTRGTECAALDSTTMQFSQSLNGISSIVGPWDACALPTAGYTFAKPAVAVDQVMSWANGTSAVSLVSQLLPQNLVSQVFCTKMCQGTGISSVNGGASQQICADLKAFSNIDASVTDYLPCAVDNTAQVNLRDFVKKSDADRDYHSLLNPGVCIAGGCRADVCSSTRCSGHGQCLLSATSRSFIDRALNLQASIYSSNVMSNELVLCRCDDGWAGEQCDIPANGLINGTGASACGPFAQQRLQAAVLTSVFSTLGGCIILSLLILALYRSVKSGGGDKDEEKLNDQFYAKYDPDRVATKRASVLSNIVLVRGKSEAKNQRHRGEEKAREPIRPSTPIEELQKLPEIEPYEAFDLHNVDISAGVLLERKSSHSQKNPAVKQSTPISSLDSSVVAAKNRQPLAPSPSDSESSEKSKDTAGNSDKANVLLPANYLRAAYAYNSRLADEIHLSVGDILYLIKVYDDGWGKAYNLRSGKEGIFPLSFTKRIVVKDASESIKNFAKGGVFSGTASTQASTSASTAYTPTPATTNVATQDNSPEPNKIRSQ